MPTLPKCPVAMGLKMLEDKFTFSMTEARMRRKKYIKLDKALRENFNDDRYSPCCDCHPMVFAYCESLPAHDGCEMFLLFTGDRSSHVCPERVFKHVRNDPKIKPFCTCHIERRGI